MRTLKIALAILTASAVLSGTARADDKIFELRRSDVKVAAGAKGSTSLTIAAMNGWHVNEEAPISVTLTPDAGLTVPKAKLDRADLADKSKMAPRFDVAFSAAEVGKKSIAAEARFVLCQETACKPVKEKFAFNIEVTPAATAAVAVPAKKK